MDFECEGRDWPHRETSRFVDLPGTEPAGDDVSMRVHVQEIGEGPSLLLIHGAGASTHSFRHVFPRFGASFRTLACDLPGHGFSHAPRVRRRSLSEVSSVVMRTLETIEFSPDLILGHSAGAAVAAHLILQHHVRPRALVSINGAFFPFTGLAAWGFPRMAEWVASSSRLSGWLARLSRIKTSRDWLLSATGSRIDEVGRHQYRVLLESPQHVQATSAMMAGWDLRGLPAAMESFPVELVLIAGGRDRAVPVDQARRLARRVHRSRLMHLSGLGHLAHEEDPSRIFELVTELWRELSPPSEDS